MPTILASRTSQKFIFIFYEQQKFHNNFYLHDGIFHTQTM
jgi:hypothetical protein